MSYREGADKFYDLFGAKDDAPFYIDLAHVPELKDDSGWFVQRRPLDADRLVTLLRGQTSIKEVILFSVMRGLDHG